MPRVTYVQQATRTAESISHPAASVARRTYVAVQRSISRARPDILQTDILRRDVSRPWNSASDTLHCDTHAQTHRDHNPEDSPPPRLIIIIQSNAQINRRNIISGFLE